jgi:hypothetical protein
MSAGRCAGLIECSDACGDGAVVGAAPGRRRVGRKEAQVDVIEIMERQIARCDFPLPCLLSLFQVKTQARALQAERRDLVQATEVFLPAPSGAARGSDLAAPPILRAACSTAAMPGLGARPLVARMVYMSGMASWTSSPLERVIPAVLMGLLCHSDSWPALTEMRLFSAERSLPPR